MRRSPTELVFARVVPGLAGGVSLPRARPAFGSCSWAGRREVADAFGRSAAVGIAVSALFAVLAFVLVFALPKQVALGAPR